MANASAVGGNTRYPSLNAIASLFRSKINDTMNNTTGTGTGSGNQAGLIMMNTNPDLLEFLNSGIQETYADLRNIGDPELIIDNYILTALPVINSNLGPGVPNPAAQVALSYAGFFDGVQWYPNWVLPIGVSKMLGIWERQTGTNNSFHPMKPAPFGIGGGMQGIFMGQWEMREGMVWMPGSTQLLDIRLRARIYYPPFLHPSTINFETAYVPILDSRNAIVSKMMINYAMRFAPEQYQMCVADEARLMGKLRLEVVRQMQGTENERAEFGAEATQDFNISRSWL